MNLIQGTKSFFIKSRRVWHALRKPSKKEYEQVAKVSAIGIALLGILGFLVGLLMKAFFV